MILAGTRADRLTLREMLDVSETLWLDGLASPVDHAKAIEELQRLAEDALTPFDQFGETETAEREMADFEERFPAALPFAE